MAAATGDFSLATDVADLLARNGVPFREAHEVVGKLVGLCTQRGITFADLTDEEWAEAHPLFAEQKPPMTALESVSARDVAGGTAPNRVRDAIRHTIMDDRIRTRDLGGKATTAEFGDAVAKRVAS